MLKLKWTHTTITNEKQARQNFQRIQKLPLTIGAFDTETDGLHIINSKPFVFQFGFIMPDLVHGETYAVHLSDNPTLGKAVIKAWHVHAVKLQKYIGHNVTFDLHMLHNLGVPYTGTNLSDTMFYIRYAHDAVATTSGGAPLKLKEYSAQYIDRNAKAHEALLDQEKSILVKKYNNLLKQRLIPCGQPPVEYGTKSYTIGVITKIFKDCIIEPTDLPENIRDAYLKWYYVDLPTEIRERMREALVTKEDIPYTMLNKENLLKYAHFDIVYPLEIYLACNPVIKARENYKGLDYEEQNIRPLFEMERVGFLADKEYLEESRIRLKEYIKKCRVRLYNMVQKDFTVGQHELIRNLINERFNLNIFSTNKNELSVLVSRLKREKNNTGAVQFIEALEELRTLEKWYSAYILRFQNDLRHSDRLYTQINAVGTISGRVTSDFQQFPKKAIVDRDKNELFHPRKIVKAEQGLVYLDYSQIELRFQAMYTILVNDADLNLCRAYMPYKCYRIENNNKIYFDYNNIEHIKNYSSFIWHTQESDSVWTPTDVHGATTTHATGLSVGDEGYEDARSDIGKRTNFAKNYGAKFKKICEMFPEYDEETCRRIDNAYYNAFPGIKTYHAYCYNMALSSSHCTNLFGVKYYNVSGHNLINLLIQGSAAYYLKIKIKEIYDYLKQNNLQTKMQMQIHDELSFKYHPADNPNIFFDIQHIMQDWTDALVPIVADMEVTKTNWAKKEKTNDLRLYFST